MTWTIFEDKSNLTIFNNLFRILRRKLNVENIEVNVINPEKALLAQKLLLSVENDSHISAFTIAEKNHPYLIVPDIHLHPQLQRHPSAQTLRCYAGVKLTLGNIVVGVLSVSDSCVRSDLFPYDYLKDKNYFESCSTCQLLLEMASVIADLLQFRLEEQYSSLINGVYLHQSILGVLQRPSQALCTRRKQLDDSLAFFYPEFFTYYNPHHHLETLDRRLQWFQSDVDYMCYIMELALRSLTHVSLDTHTRTYYTDANADFFLFPQPSSNNSSATPSIDASLSVPSTDHQKIVDDNNSHILYHVNNHSIHKQETEKHGIMAARRKSLTLLRNTTAKYSIITIDKEFNLNNVNNIINYNGNRNNNVHQRHLSYQPHPLGLSSTSQQQTHHQHLCLFRRRQWLQSLHRLLEHSQTNAVNTDTTLSFNNNYNVINTGNANNIGNSLSLSIATTTLSDRMCVSVSCDVSPHCTLLLSAPCETLLLAISLCVTPLRLLQQSLNQRPHNIDSVALSLTTHFCVSTQTLTIVCRSEAFHFCPLDSASIVTLETLVEKVFGGCVVMGHDAVEVKLPAVSLTADPLLWASLAKQQQTVHNNSIIDKTCSEYAVSATVVPVTLKIVNGDTVETVEIDADSLSLGLNKNDKNNDVVGNNIINNNTDDIINNNRGKNGSFGLSSTGFVFPSLRIRTAPYDTGATQNNHNNNPVIGNHNVPFSSNVTVLSTSSSTTSSEGRDTTAMRNPSLVADEAHSDTPVILRITNDDNNNSNNKDNVKSRSSTMCSSVPSTPVHTNSLNVNNVNSSTVVHSSSNNNGNVVGNVVHFIANAWTHMFSPRTNNDTKATIITNTVNDNNNIVNGNCPQSSSQSFYSGYFSIRSPLSVVSTAVTPVSHHKSITNVANNNNNTNTNYNKNHNYYYYAASPRNNQINHLDSGVSLACPSSPGGSAESVYSEGSGDSNCSKKSNKKNNNKKLLKPSSVAPLISSY